MKILQIRKWNIGMAQKEGRQDRDGLHALMGICVVHNNNYRALMMIIQYHKTLRMISIPMPYNITSK